MNDSVDIAKMVNLRERDLRREGMFVAEGHLLVERAIQAGYEPVSLVSSVPSSKEAAALVTQINSLFPAVHLSIVSDEELEAIAGYPFHRGLLALFRRPDLPSPGPLPDLSSVPRILVLPAITDPGNLGTLLRSALAFGFTTVLFGSGTGDPFNRKVLRASMGAVFSLSMLYATAGDLDVLATKGRLLYAAEMTPDAVSADDAHPGAAPIALILGNEFDGIPEGWRRFSTCSVQIPVSGEVDSLNVAVAGSILMWEYSSGRLP